MVTSSLFHSNFSTVFDTACNKWKSNISRLFKGQVYGQGKEAQWEDGARTGTLERMRLMVVIETESLKQRKLDRKERSQRGEKQHGQSFIKGWFLGQDFTIFIPDIRDHMLPKDV